MTTIIAFTGKRDSGKSAASKVLVNEYAFQEVKFADPLKNMLRALYKTCGMGADEIERRLEGDLKEEGDPILSGRTPRHAMQTLGTEWRDMISTDLWSDIFTQRATGGHFGQRIVCSDLRFPHEIECLHRIGGYAIRINRPVAANADDDYAKHVSERGIADLPVATEIMNDGDLAYLQEQVRAIADNHLRITRVAMNDSELDAVLKEGFTRLTRNQFSKLHALAHGEYRTNYAACRSWIEEQVALSA